ncbi:MAG: PAS domain-containing sensor histidine kinase [Firmicutes bacterium]|nr:PAS domain-containing sensor histidine kinase [Bacillota bacterium]
MKILKNSILSIAFFTLAFYLAEVLRRHTGDENNSSLIFIVAIVLIARFTDGYWYGVVASALSVFFVNYSFMYPFSQFTLQMEGYHVVAISFFAASVTVSAVTTRMRKETAQNERLYKEQTEIKLAVEKGMMRENLLRAVSHDLRTPLTGIIGASSVIYENHDTITSEETAQLAQNIITDAQWLINMVENLLSVTHTTEYGAKINKTNEIFEEIVALPVQKVKTRYPDCKISVEVPEEILLVPMDGLLIRQVLLNLVENAVKHSGDRENIVIRLYRQDDMAVCEVRDHGKGIGFENIDKLIEDVTMNKDTVSDATRGLGLGLSVCKSIIKAHGGFLEAENAADGDGGAVFRFGLKMEEIPVYEQH